MRSRLFAEAALPLVATLTLVGGLVLAQKRVAARPPLPPAVQIDTTTGTVMDAGLDASTNATLVFTTAPFVAAVVTSGKNPLGTIRPGRPLVVVRPRDSGPLDVVVRAAGYVLAKIRVPTSSDAHVMVKLTPLDKNDGGLGHRVPLDAGASDGAAEASIALDAGVGRDAAQLPNFLPPATPLAAPVRVF